MLEEEKIIEMEKQLRQAMKKGRPSKISGKMLGKHFEGNFRHLRVWKMFDGQLKVIIGSCVGIPNYPQ